MTGPQELSALLQAVRTDLLSFLRRHAGFILRFETPEDLLQELHVRVLEHGGDFVYRGREAALKWLYEVARTYLADRRKHWSSLKRRSAGLLRLTAGAPSGSAGGAAEPAGTATGPSTFAARKELLALAVRALAVLPDRDRRLVRWTTEGVALEEQAERLSLSYDAAKHARNRALERYRKAYRLASGGR